jgi:hypothetical protein
MGAEESCEPEYQRPDYEHQQGHGANKKFDLMHG